MKKIYLSDTQRKIVCHRDGPLLVNAGAGSGKTRVLTERIRYLLENKQGHYRILALTFTNKAADEMAERLKDVDNLKERTYIGTLHKFCMQIICDRGSIIGISREPQIFDKVEDRKIVLRQVFASEPELKQIAKKKMSNEKEGKRFLGEVLEKLSKAKRVLRDPEYYERPSLGERGRLFSCLYRKYNELLISQNALDYDDILFITYRILTQFPIIAEFYRRLYRYICVDEAQDLNYAQYSVIKSLCGTDFRNLMLVGDPNQSIYGFNDSSSKFMLEDFVRDFDVPGENIITLTENYRSSINVVKAANCLEPLSIEGTLIIPGEVQAVSLADEGSEAQWVVQKIASIKSQGHPDVENLSWSDFAVLGRNRYVYKKIEEELKKANIPYHHKRSKDNIESESEFMRCFELGMHLIINPQNRLHLRRLLELTNYREINEFFREINDREYEKGVDILCHLSMKLKNFSCSDYFQILLRTWKELDKPFLRFGYVLKSIIRDYILNSSKDEENKKALTLNDIKMWLDHWKCYVRQNASDQHNLSAFLNQVALGATFQSQDQGVALLTVHTSKGLEFDVVFIVGMYEGGFPDYRSLKGGAEMLKEEKHNAYVAITRSKRLVYITYPRKKLMPQGDLKTQQPSRFLKQIDISICDM